MLQRLALLRRARLERAGGEGSAILLHNPQPLLSPHAPLLLPSSLHPLHHQSTTSTTTITTRTFLVPSSHPSNSNSVDGKIGADEDAVAALFDGALGPAAGLNDPRRKRIKDPDADRPKLLTARRESLALYREVLRVSNLFVWRDERGAAWRDRIRSSARAEFEAARGETDPELVTRMIVTARDALHRAVDQFRQRRAAIIEDEARRADAGVVAGPPPPTPLDVAQTPSWGQGVPLVRGGGGGGGGERR
jgi:hypothetical protein